MAGLIGKITKNLNLKEGIWFSKEQSIVSYPLDGNDLSLQLEENSFWFKHRNNCILQIIKNYSLGEEIIDIGGGNGYVSFFLQENQYNAILIEPGFNGCLNAQKRGLQNIVCSSFQNLGIDSFSVSNIGIFDVLEHIEKDLDFLIEINKILKKGGKLFLTVPAFRFLWSNDDFVAGHFRRYNLEKIKKLLENAGFQIEYASYFFFILIFPIFLFRTIPSLFFKKEKLDLKKNLKEHGQNKTTDFLQRIWNWEIMRIVNSRKIPFGSSCLIVARK